MSQEDDSRFPKIVPMSSLNKSNQNSWRNCSSNQNGIDKRNEINVSHNGFTKTTDSSGNDICRNSSHVWSPLLEKDPHRVDDMDMYDTSNNNEWKAAEEINNLKNNLHRSHGNNNGSLINDKNGIGSDKISDQISINDIYKINDDTNSCGIFNCRPKWARSLASTHVFMVVFLLAWVLQGMFLTYFVSVITTIEKLFQIKSKTTGILMSAGEIGQISTALLLTYYAGRGHRPRWIALGMAIFAVASLCCALPHFLFGKQLMQANFILRNGKESISDISLAENLAMPLDNFNLCHMSDNFTKAIDKNEECGNDVKIEQASHSKITFIVMCIFFTSLLLSGVGQTAVSTLGIPYIDDNVASQESAMYLAITIGVRILGPASGFIVGSFCTRIYVDLSNPGIDPTDPKWISAWWLGPVFIGFLMILASIAMFMFPKELIGKKITKNEKTEAIKKSKTPHDIFAKPKLKDFPRTLRRQLTNDILMFRTASCVFHLLPIAGLYTFLPKYLETQFRLSAADANLISAIGGILVMGVGIVISGFVILKINPSARFIAAWIALTALIYAFGMIILMFLGCSMSDFVGLDPDSGKIQSFGPACNVTCDCDITEFSPICGSDGRTYFSSCQAGCNSADIKDGKQVFGNCECITDISEELTMFEATSGYCDGSCKNFIFFICLFSFCVFIHSTSEVGSMLLIMRCTDPKDKAMAMGVIQSAIGLFGNVPCPIIYGAVVDSACLVWKTVCGDPGACSLYDNNIFRQYFLGTTACIMLLAFLMDLIVWHKANRIDITPTDHPVENGIEQQTIVPESHV